MAVLPVDPWERPWLLPFADVRAALADPCPRQRLSELASQRRVVSGAGRALRFVSPNDAGEAAYETHIAQTGRVPTRDHWHDWLNAAVWLTWPRLKATLNQRQAQCLASAQPAAGGRGAQRDAATLLDESGVVLAVDTRRARVDALRQCVADHDWQRLFVHWRERWHRDWTVWLVGHAALEKLLDPYPGITARAAVVGLAGEAIDQVSEVDAQLARVLANAPNWAAHDFPPLPVLGIPRWWPANASATFYDNAQVFRPKKRSSVCGA